MSGQLSKDDMRNARLRALGQVAGASTEERVTPPPPPPPPTPVTSTSSGEASSGGDVAMMVEGSGEGESTGGLRRKRKMTAAELASIKEIMWPAMVTDDDLRRWHQQGFSFCENPSFGLEQGHGGPCGVLAAVQGEIIRLLVFPDERGSTELPSPSLEAARVCLADALLTVLTRLLPTPQDVEVDPSVAVGGYKIVTCAETPCTVATPPELFDVFRFGDVEEARAFLLNEGLVHFQSQSGVILFVYSMLLTKGPAAIRMWMDAPDNTLTGQFGHCTQELLNLLLIGKAVSNVFDGDRALGDTGLTLHGIPSRPDIGYLTHLEALRYVQVGSLYKTPVYPIWVVGSTSHFTVLFSLDKACNEESEAEQLLSRVQRAFRKYDPTEGGILELANLGPVLVDLGIPMGQNEDQVGALKAKLEVTGAGIVLWDDFWRAVSRLLTGASLEEVLTGDHRPTPMEVIPVEEETSMGGGRPRSDSDLARELQAQLDAGHDDFNLGSGSRGPAAPASSTHQGNRPRSDSDLAREMQADFDREVYGIGASGTTATSVSSSTPPPSHHTERPRPPSPVEPERSCPLFHYNGLVGPGGRSSRLVKLSLTKRSQPASVVGLSVALGASPMGTGSAFACPIEEVLTTKWPGARFNWYGAAPPSID